MHTNCKCFVCMQFLFFQKSCYFLSKATPTNMLSFWKLNTNLLLLLLLPYIFIRFLSYLQAWYMLTNSWQYQNPEVSWFSSSSCCFEHRLRWMISDRRISASRISAVAEAQVCWTVPICRHPLKWAITWRAVQVKSGSLAGQWLTFDLNRLRSQIRCCQRGMYSSEASVNIVSVICL